MSANDPVSYYDTRASSLAARFDGVSFDQVHGLILHHLPDPPADVLDVGAGSGRDAAALELLGYRVTAVEPAGNLRRLGEARTAQVEWIDDRLPALVRLRKDGRSYDFIFCSAVLMSIPPEELTASLQSMARLLEANGKLMVSVRDAAKEDAASVFYSHSPEALDGAARAVGLSLVESKILLDALGRGHQWRALVYRRADTPA